MAFFEKNPESNLKIVLVPSLADAHHDHCYPQPPLADLMSGGVKSPFFPDELLFTLGLGDSSLREVRSILLLSAAHLCTSGSRWVRWDVAWGARVLSQRVQCVSNPAMITVNEVVVGITSTDVLMQLGKVGGHVSM